MTAGIISCPTRLLAPLLLAIAMLVGGTVDAAACQFDDIASISIASADSDDAADNDDTHNEYGCLHGHCHHGAHTVVGRQELISIPHLADVHGVGEAERLTTFFPDLPEQPPRL